LIIVSLNSDIIFIHTQVYADLLDVSGLVNSNGFHKLITQFWVRSVS